MKQFGHIKNVFAPEVVDNLLGILNRLPNTPNSGNLSRAYTNGFQPGDPAYLAVRRIVLDPLERLFDNQLPRLHVGMFLKEHTPWEIHSDYNKGDQNPNVAILIPLQIISDDSAGKTHTIIFNEQSTDNSMQDYLKSNPIVPKYPATELHQQYLDHVPEEQLNYLSLALVAEWSPGDVIYWDRRLLHASDNFVKNGVGEKYALVLFFTD